MPEKRHPFVRKSGVFDTVVVLSVVHHQSSLRRGRTKTLGARIFLSGPVDGGLSSLPWRVRRAGRGAPLRRAHSLRFGVNRKTLVVGKPKPSEYVLE